VPNLKRKISPFLSADLEKKIVLLSGPRQVGKTTLSRGLFANHQYLNFDATEDRKIIRNETWNRNTDLVVFDEIHKLAKWKSWIKGIYDTEGVRPRLLLTGSARLETFKKGGDSLAGRHHSFRLYPFTPAELLPGISAAESVDRLLRLGGFPEPFLSDSEDFAKRWRKSHLDRILKEDLLELEAIRELKKMEILVDLLADRVGSTTSFSSLARDLEVSPHTVKRWTEVLESLYVIFSVRPYSKNSARSLLKEPKFYFFDIGRVTSGEAGRVENLVALGLLKDLHFKADTRGDRVELAYLRDKEKREVDFVTIIDRKVESLIEVKVSDPNVTPALRYYFERLKPTHAFQLVHRLGRSASVNGIEVTSVADHLSHLET
jgi:predicted AAA+ superfamily ATPase